MFSERFLVPPGPAHAPKTAANPALTATRRYVDTLFVLFVLKMTLFCVAKLARVEFHQHALPLAGV